MIKKIFAALLAVLMCFAVVGCSGDGDAPDGMQISSLEGEPFKLYVPDAWTVNTQSGISCAYYSALDNITVSARYFTPADSSLTLDDYITGVCVDYSNTLELFNLVSNSPAVLGGADAKVLVYTAKHEGKDFTFRQVITRHGGDFVFLTFYCPTELYEDNSAQFDSIVSAFVLCEKSADTGDCVTDKKTPAGMKIASADHIEYRLYVPTSWVCNSQTVKSEAYYPESGRPNVTVTSYSPDSDMTAQQYFELCETEYRQTLSGYAFICQADRTVAGKSSVSYTYTVSYGGTTVKIMQTVLVYSGLVYSITYTALADSFDGHMDDVNSILDSFTFR